MDFSLFVEHFCCIKDPRQKAKIDYPFFDLLFGSLCAIIAGAEGWKDIQEYIDGHLSWFQKQGFFSHGSPVDDTIARAIGRIEPKQFQQCFISWMQSVHQLTDGELVAIDGKTLRGSYCPEDRKSTIHMVNAYACANHLVLGQHKTDAKSNEITAIPELIALLDIKGALISIDAMGCQKGIAKCIVDKGADYLLAVKTNQESLYLAIRAAFEEQLNAEPCLEQFYVEQQHGRLEARFYAVQEINHKAAPFSQWKGAKSIGVTMGFRKEKGKAPTLDYRYYISSKALDKEEFADAVRGHWAIESMHWQLDVCLKEDDCQIYKDHGAQNWSIMRQFSLNMLKAEPSKASLITKRNRAWMRTDFLEKILMAGLAKMAD